MELWEWIKLLPSVDPKLLPPLIATGLGVYLLLAKRIKAVEVRMTAVETSTATLAGINKRLDDLFDLLKAGLGVHHIDRSPVIAATPTDEIRLRELARAHLESQRDR